MYVHQLLVLIFQHEVSDLLKAHPLIIKLLMQLQYLILHHL